MLDAICIVKYLGKNIIELTKVCRAMLGPDENAPITTPVPSPGKDEPK